MSFTEKIDVLELLISLLKEHEQKLDSLVENMEIVEHTLARNFKLSEKIYKPDSSATKGLASQSILVVDDDKSLASSFKLILESVGYDVDTADTGLSALYQMSKKTYDLVLLDLNLPDMLGDEVAEKIEENYGDTDIIFITGYSSMKGGLEKELLMKPIDPDSLLQSARERLDRIRVR